MHSAREIVSLALEARTAAKIKVRQPLRNLKIKDQKLKLNEDFLKLIKDEVNVKEIIFDASLPEAVWLDTLVTPELKIEGELR